MLCGCNRLQTWLEVMVSSFPCLPTAGQKIEAWITVAFNLFQLFLQRFKAGEEPWLYQDM